jgi:hypothetical protein
VADPADVRQGGDLPKRLFVGPDHVREVAVELARLTPCAEDPSEPLVLDRADELNQVVMRSPGQSRGVRISRMGAGGTLLIDSRQRRVNGAAVDRDLVLIGDVLHQVVASEPLAL